MKLIDLTGQKFGRLTVISRAPNKGQRPCWKCHCECGSGNEHIVQGSNLRRGNTKSCGCMESRFRCGLAGPALKHGHATEVTGHSKTYNSRRAMLARCTNTPHKYFPKYGGATPPVLVCDRWLPEKGGSFENFLQDKGPRPPGTTLGRYLDMGDYTPENTAWMTPTEQGAEMRKKNASKQAA